VSDNISIDQTVTVLKSWDNKSLLQVLSEAYGLSKNKAKQILDSRNVFVNNKRVWIAKYLVRQGDKIHIAGAQLKKDNTSSSKIEVIFEDQWILVVNKPSGMLSNGPKSLEENLRKIKNSKLLRVAHRLDRDTSGAIIVAKNDEVFDKIKNLFSEHKVSKTYSALVVGYATRPAKFSIDTPLDGKSALSIVELKKNFGKVSLIDVQIITGRTHQIRRHLISLNIALLGDKEYFNKHSNSEEFRKIPRQMLHATTLEFCHPITCKNISVKANLAGDFQAVLKSFSGKRN
jgi:23S rRNA pseudouridine1911/1915/1917 synthase